MFALQRPDDTTSLHWEESTASEVAYEAAVKGHILSKHAKGHGKPLEKWMTNMEVGTVVLKLMCVGGSVVVRDNEEEVLDQEGVKGEDDLMLESVCVELPIPDGLHVSFMVRMLEEIVARGRAAGTVQWEREQEESEARRLAALERPSLFRRMSTKFCPITVNAPPKTQSKRK